MSLTVCVKGNATEQKPRRALHTREALKPCKSAPSLGHVETLSYPGRGLSEQRSVVQGTGAISACGEVVHVLLSQLHLLAFSPWVKAGTTCSFWTQKQNPANNIDIVIQQHDHSVFEVSSWHQYFYNSLKHYDHVVISQYRYGIVLLPGSLKTEKNPPKNMDLLKWHIIKFRKSINGTDHHDQFNEGTSCVSWSRLSFTQTGLLNNKTRSAFSLLLGSGLHPAGYISKPLKHVMWTADLGQ